MPAIVGESILNNSLNPRDSYAKGIRKSGRNTKPSKITEGNAIATAISKKVMAPTGAQKMRTLAGEA